MVNASMVEGSGIFKCTNSSHEKEFVTEDLDKFNKHLLEKGHTVSGSAPCAVCDKQVTFDSLPVGKKPVCDECKKELSE
jgi:hypothetical protein